MSSERTTAPGRVALLAAALALVACSQQTSTSEEPPPDLFQRLLPAAGPPQAFIMSADVNLTPEEFLEQ